MSNKETCFVVSPIGEEGSEVRHRSDQVFEHIIADTVKPLGYEPIRADHITEPGIITSQVIQHVVEAPLVIADLTGWNPNVFYELAIRHALKKPLIQMIAAGERIPFDIASTRTIRVDLRDLDSVMNAKQELKKQIESITSGTGEIDSPISVAFDLKLLRESEDPGQRSLADLTTAISEMRKELRELDNRLRDAHPGDIQSSKLDEEVTNEAVYVSSSRLYGLTYNNLTVRAVLNEDGSMDVTRENALQAHESGIEKIDHFLLAPEAPKDKSKPIDGIKLEAVLPFVKLTPDIVKQASDRLALIVDISPSLSAGQTLEYVFSGKMPSGSVAMTHDELDSWGLDYEFLAWDITRPTKQLTLRLFIPKDVQPNTTNYAEWTDYDVWYGISRLTHDKERRRVEKHWIHESGAQHHELKLDIPYPILGLTYVIKWIPSAHEGNSSSK